MSPAAQVEQWLGRLADERHASPHTLAAYRRDLAKLLRNFLKGLTLRLRG